MHNHMEDTNQLLGSKSPGLLGTTSSRGAQIGDKSVENREKSGSMYSSLIVGKSDEYKKLSGLASGDKIKELNSWADELKKKLTPLLN